MSGSVGLSANSPASIKRTFWISSMPAERTAAKSAPPTAKCWKPVRVCAWNYSPGATP